PTRPMVAGAPPGSRGIADELGPPAVLMGLAAALTLDSGGPDLARYFADTSAVPICSSGVPVRDLPDDCPGFAPTPEELFAKLDDWGFPAIVIPHGTTWGIYTPPGSAWDKQLTPAQHDPDRQTLIEVYLGHRNSAGYREWRDGECDPAGNEVCPAPRDGYEPCCWRAGEMIRERCKAPGTPECEEAVVAARRLYLAAGVNARFTVPGATVEDWRDCGSCPDCFIPSYNYRPKSSVQYI